MFEVCVTGLSEEDEVMLFLEASGLKFPSEMGVTPRVVETPPRTKPQACVCFRCGQAGHMARNCPKQVPSVEKLAELNEKERETVISRILEKEKLYHDEFGLTRVEPMPGHTPSWENEAFCDNCGKRGHTNERCWFPHFEQTRSFFSLMQEDGRKDDVLMRYKFRSFWRPP